MANQDVVMFKVFMFHLHVPSATLASGEML
jgi:hypothetical protein